MCCLLVVVVVVGNVMEVPAVQEVLFIPPKQSLLKAIALSWETVVLAQGQEVVRRLLMMVKTPRHLA